MTASQKSIELKIVSTADEMGNIVAGVIREKILTAKERNVNIFFATGSTPLPAYKRLIEMRRGGELSFRNADAFILDEYLGLPENDPNTYRNFISSSLFDHIDLSEKNRHFPASDAEHPESAAAHYENAIKKAGGIDAIILGIGDNGHIAFNEPGTPKDARTRVVTLTDRTRRANARFFGSIDLVPTHALTIGIGNILEARTAILMATGARKAPAIEQALVGPVTPDVPASFLQEMKGELIVVLDQDAASRLPRAVNGRSADVFYCS